MLSAFVNTFKIAELRQRILFTFGLIFICRLIAAIPLDRVIAKLDELGVPLIEGPVAKTGAVHPLRSVYIRDPDGNLVEISERAG